MSLKIKNKQDLLGGCVIGLFGLVGVVEGYRLGVGSLTQMEPGFVPMSLGFILIFLGGLMAVRQAEPSDGQQIIFEHPEWLGWFCIVAGVVAFIVLGQYAGLVPASLACIFISALGDRSATVKGAAILSVCVTFFGVLLFHFVLQISIPLFWWES